MCITVKCGILYTEILPVARFDGVGENIQKFKTERSDIVRLLQKLRELFLPKRKSAAAFVDYEYWFYSMRNLFHIDPDPKKWIEEVRAQYSVEDIYIYADFGSNGMAESKKIVQELDCTVVDTADESTYRRKDMTDFVMLDAIYQSVNELPAIDTYILFTGDGHFQSVARYLKERKKKTVILYGILDSVSKRLQEEVTECKFLPNSAVREAVYRRMIVENFAYIADKSHIYPTFKGTVDAVSRKYAVDYEEIQRVMRKMIEEGYVVRRDYYVEFRKTIKIIAPAWDKLIEGGYWDPENQRALEKVAGE